MELIRRILMTVNDATGGLRTIVDSTFGIGEAAAAIEWLAERRAVGGKVLLLGTGGDPR